MRLTLLQSKRRRTSSAHAKAASDSDSDDAPLLSKTKNNAGVALKKPPKASETAVGESSDSDIPMSKKLAAEKSMIEKRAEKEAKAIRQEEKQESAPAKKKPKKQDSDDENQDVSKRRRKLQTNASMNVKKKRTNGVKSTESDDDDDVPLSRKKSVSKATKPAKSEPSTPAKKGRKGRMKQEDVEDVEAEEGEEEYRWWDDPTKHDGTIKWKTLEHNGVVFPPPYEPLPKRVKMKYDGVPVTLHPDAEEVAGFFGSMLNSTHNVENPTFQKNFFKDFTEILKKTGGAKDKEGNSVSIKEFAKCDFKPIFEYYDAKREEKKALPAAEKKALKAEKDAAEVDFMYCTWDTRKQKVGNFRVEPPGLFRGRGEHPKTGKVKTRVQPEQITINIGKEAKVPEPPPGHRWKEVKHDQEGTWLAMWQENVNGNYKYVMLAANSDVKGQSDHKKFEKARELKVSCLSRKVLTVLCL